MKLYLDSGDINEIRYWLTTGAICGITMNPLILCRQGVRDADAHLAQVLELAGDIPVSMQVGGGSLDAIVAQARKFATMGPNVVVKVPIIDPDGNSTLPIIAELSHGGLRLNVTACMNAMQGIMAASAGATYVSLFAGRIEDEGGSAPTQVGYLREWMDRESSSARIIVGSVRQPGSIYPLIAAGAHVCTVPPAVLHKALDHSFARRTAKEFVEAAQSAHCPVSCAGCRTKC